MTKTKTPSKCEFGAPSVTLDRNPRVLAYDDAGMDDGRRMVTLVYGWAFEGAAANEGDDPNGASALHCRGCDNVKDALEAIRYAKPCKCGRCLDGKRREARKTA